VLVAIPHFLSSLLQAGYPSFTVTTLVANAAKNSLILFGKTKAS
jgi:hypothetical protein